MENLKDEIKDQKSILKSAKESEKNKKIVIELIEKKHRKAETHLNSMKLRDIPNEVREWHEMRVKLNLNMASLLMSHFNKL